MTFYKGIHNLDLDAADQIEYNRKRNLIQDDQIKNINVQLTQLLEQAPAGFLPRVYYGLTRGEQTYRFAQNAALYQSLDAGDGTAFELYSQNESDNSYIPAIAVKINDTVLSIIIQGDYNYDSTVFDAINMVTGESTTITFDSSPLRLQNASSLSDYPAFENRGKQITVINNLETNSKNVVFASIDINADGFFNWVDIANFVDGKDGLSVKSVNAATYSTVVSDLVIGDTLLSAEEFTTGGNSFAIGGLYKVNALSPLELSLVGNIRGERGLQGIQGIPGQDGQDGSTPYIQNDYWYIDGTSTGVKAVGTDGLDGQDGQSFQMQSGLYSTPDNWGQSGNVDGDGNNLLQLPTLPQNNISGKGYVVYDPLTTPLAPFYDLYYANNGDNDWTIIHPFSGIAGQDGQDGHTPYIQGGTWWINGVNTGVNATGPQGATGQPGSPGQNGQDGSTPYIQNGTWWIGSTDTGVNATGPQGSPGQNGQDGNSPYISGGKWWVGSTNTGVDATGPQGATGPAAIKTYTVQLDSVTKTSNVGTFTYDIPKFTGTMGVSMYNDYVDGYYVSLNYTFGSMTKIWSLDSVRLGSGGTYVLYITDGTNCITASFTSSTGSSWATVSLSETMLTGQLTGTNITNALGYTPFSSFSYGGSNGSGTFTTTESTIATFNSSSSYRIVSFCVNTYSTGSHAADFFVRYGSTSGTAYGGSTSVAAGTPSDQYAQMQMSTNSRHSCKTIVFGIPKNTTVYVRGKGTTSLNFRYQYTTITFA